jgi:hypothetical protein
MMGVGVKSFIEVEQQTGSKKYTLGVNFYSISTISNIQDPNRGHDMKFGQIISNSMQGEIMFHLSNPSYGVQAIKFIHINFGKMKVMMKGVGMKGHGMGGFISF